MAVANSTSAFQVDLLPGDFAIGTGTTARSTLMLGITRRTTGPVSGILVGVGWGCVAVADGSGVETGVRYTGVGTTALRPSTPLTKSQ